MLSSTCLILVSKNKNMKKTLLFAFVLFTGTFTTLNAQTWTAQTSGTSAGLSSVHFSSPTKGWAVGSSGVIIHTNDGGTTWSSQSSGVGSSTHLSDVHFVDGLTGFAVGTANTILKTTDGINWSGVALGAPGTVNLTAVWVDASTVRIAGDMGIYAYSSNWGSSWSPNTTGALNAADIEFVGLNGWLVDQIGNILKTTNGGSSWSTQVSGFSAGLNSISFIDQNEGWIAGNSGLILHTTDGGANWNAQTTGITTTIHSIYFASSTHGWATSGGNVLSTTNGGTTWTIQTGVSTSNLLSIYFPSTTVGYAVGGNGSVYKFTGSSLDLEENTTNTVSIYPNPATDFLTIDTKEAIETIEIYSNLGQLVKTETATNFSIADLNSGVYFVHVTTEKGKSITRLVKE
jgi:photosystem II stability/assembly factor-like uncharacterized protein